MLITIGGCGGSPVKKPDVVVNEITAIEPLECGAEPEADKTHMRKVEPWVVTDVAGLTWIGISPQHYENLSANVSDMLAHLKQRRAQVEWWRDCVDAHNERAARFGEEASDDAKQDEPRGGSEHDPPPTGEGSSTPPSEGLADEG